jgi:hypothetical protein
MEVRGRLYKQILVLEDGRTVKLDDMMVIPVHPIIHPIIQKKKEEQNRVRTPG